jgi:hypothetical protein
MGYRFGVSLKSSVPSLVWRVRIRNIAVWKGLFGKALFLWLKKFVLYRLAKVFPMAVSNDMPALFVSIPYIWSSPPLRSPRSLQTAPD